MGSTDGVIGSFMFQLAWATGLTAYLEHFWGCFLMRSEKPSKADCSILSSIQPSEGQKKKNHRKSNRFSSDSKCFVLTELTWSLSELPTKIKISFWVSSFSAFRLELIHPTLLVLQLVGNHLKILQHPSFYDSVVQFHILLPFYNRWKQSSIQLLVFWRIKCHLRAMVSSGKQKRQGKSSVRFERGTPENEKI